MTKQKSSFGVLTDIIENEEIKIMAEIGVWKCRLLRKILNKCQDQITQYWAVDIWEPSNSHRKYQKTTKEQWDFLYLKACKLMILFPQLHIIKTSSLNASKLFPPNYLDLVFIDADHRYNSVLSDIKAWLPLIRNNGFLIGHDYWSQHRGVTEAVDEYFGNDIVIERPFWIKKVVK